MYFKKIVFLIGPTGIGKTELAIKLVELFPFEIISIDSIMVYKYMDIGTGKPSIKVLNLFKHNLISFKEPSDFYSVYNFLYDILNVVKSCWRAGKVPLLVGGSMMYFDMLSYYIKQFFCLYPKLLSFFNIGVIPLDKNDLYLKLKYRLFNMLDNGFIDEVYFLYNYFGFKYNSLRSIGYNEIWSYFDGFYSFKEAKENILNLTYNFSLKQLMWMKKSRYDFVYYELLGDNLFTKLHSYLFCIKV